MVAIPFPDHKNDHCQDACDGEKGNKRGIKPVFALPLIQYHLQSAETKCDQGQTSKVDGMALGFFLSLHHMGWILHHEIRKKERQQTEWHVDVEDPTPTIVVGDPPSKRRTDSGR